MKHHGIDFGVEKKPPSWWHWKIYSKIKASPAVVGNMKFQTRAAAIAACIVEIDKALTNRWWLVIDPPVVARNRPDDDVRENEYEGIICPPVPGCIFSIEKPASC